MNVYRAAFIFLVSIIFMLIGVVLFCFIVPMNFYVSAIGRIEPNDSRSLKAPESGKVVYLCQEKKFSKGDLLFALDTASEEFRLKFLKEEELLRKKELTWIKKKIKLDKLEFKWALRQNLMNINKTRMEMTMQKKQLEINKTISENLQKQKKLDEEMKEKEAKIFEFLYKKHLLPKLDFLRIMYEKSLAKTAAQEAEIRTMKTMFETELQANRLEHEHNKLQAEKLYLQTVPESMTTMFEIENRLMQIKKEKAALKLTISKRRINAPFDGVVLLCAEKIGGFAKQNNVVMNIADLPNICFRTVLTADQRSDISLESKCDLYLDKYSFHKHGFMSGKIRDIQTGLASLTGNSASSVDTRYYLSISIEDPFMEFVPGLTGRADIIIFNGTIFQYIMKKRNN